MIIVDTTVWVDLFAGTENLQSLWLQREVNSRRLALTDLILCEVLQGIREEAVFAAAQRRLDEFTIFDSGGEDLAVASARNYRFLRACGITIRKTIDCVIATFCILHGHSLLHHDRDFDPFEEHLGLHVIHPTIF